MTADLIIHINIGPGIVWTSALLLFGGALFLTWHLSAIRVHMENARTVEHLTWYQLRAPHIAPAPLIPLQRVDPKTANIIRRYGAEEEIDDAA